MSKNNLLRLKNLDTLYSESYSARIINNSNFTDTQVMEEFVKRLFYEMDKDLEYICSCECGEYRGNYYEGATCPLCGTVVSSRFTTALVNINWLEIPPEFPAVIHPVFFTIFKEWLGKTKSVKGARTKKAPIIEAILDPTLPLPEDLKHIIKEQGFSYFNEHYEEIINYFLHDYKPKKGNKWNPYIEYMMREYKDCFFCRKLPILHPSMHPLAKEGKVKTVDTTASMIVPAIVDLSIAGNTIRRKIVAKKYADKTIWKVYSKYIEYQEVIITRKISDKFSHCRRQMAGSRIHFSGRSVITPITTRHMGDELEIPFKIACNSLKFHVINILMNKRGYSYNDAVAKQVKSLVNWDEEVYEVIEELKQMNGGHFDVLAGRNPTLIHGAIQKFKATKIKKDLTDVTLSISPRVVAAPNADFDGKRF